MNMQINAFKCNANTQRIVCDLDEACLIAWSKMDTVDLIMISLIMIGWIAFDAFVYFLIYGIGIS